MLRLKRCLDECGIQQQALATGMGWSKAQVSVTLNAGRMPVNEAKFRADTYRFVSDTAIIQDWLKLRGLTMEQLFDSLDAKPAWGCGEWGVAGHDPRECRECCRRFEGEIARKRGRSALGISEK